MNGSIVTEDLRVAALLRSNVRLRGSTINIEVPRYRSPTDIKPHRAKATAMRAGAGGA